MGSTSTYAYAYAHFFFFVYTNLTVPHKGRKPDNGVLGDEPCRLNGTAQALGETSGSQPPAQNHPQGAWRKPLPQTDQAA